MRAYAVAATLAAAFHLADPAGYSATARPAGEPAVHETHQRTYAEYEVTLTWLDWVRAFLAEIDRS